METTIEVGGFVLEPGNPSGTGIRRDGAIGADPASLREALASAPAEEEERPLALAAEVEEASEATAKIERAVALGKGIADGKALDPAQLGLEVSSLLDCLERLDHKGKHKKSIQMARALTSLLMLLKRWADLLRTLRIALRAGKALDDNAAIAWARHELGTLRLASGDVAGADRDLSRACEIRERIGDHRGLAASERNMRALCEQLREMVQNEELARPLPGGGRPPALRLSLVLLLAIVFAAGTGAGVLAAGAGDGGTPVAQSPGSSSGGGGPPATDTEISSGIDSVSIPSTPSDTSSVDEVITGETGTEPEETEPPPAETLR